jgi:sterol desaturase/sphingolipid hydroxylase (fatty acid hydroxylase superfamily)
MKTIYKIWIYFAMFIGLLGTIFKALQYIGVANREVLWPFRNNWWLQLTSPSNNLGIIIHISIILILGVVVIFLYKVKPIKESPDFDYSVIKHIAVAILWLFILYFLIIYLWVFTGHEIPPFTSG